MNDDGRQQHQPPPPYGHDAPPPSAAQVNQAAAAQNQAAAQAAMTGTDLESMDLNILREWLDESFSDDDADVSSSDGGSESLLQLLYQHNFHQQNQQQINHHHPYNNNQQQQQQHFGGGYGDPEELKHMMVPRTSSAKRPRATEKRQRNNITTATSMSDGEDNTDDVTGKKRAWPNQREELVYLRTKVCTLENELRDLKTASRKQFSALSRITSAPDGSGMVACSTPGSLWEQVANRQLDEKVRAEVENRKLRGMVESQIRLAKKLQQLLRKRQIWEGLMEKKPNLESDMKPEESKIYAFLGQKIADRHPLIDAFFAHHGLADATTETRDVNVKFDDAASGLSGDAGTPGGMFIEMKEVKIMPFDFRAANVAVWRCLRAEIITMHNMSATVVDTEENVLRAKVALKIDGRGSEVALTIWSLWRRYVEPERIIYCVESLAITGGGGTSGAPIIQIKQSATAIVGQYQGTSAPDASIVRVYVRSTPTIIQDASAVESGQEPTGPAAMARHPAVGMLTDMLIGSYHQNVEAMYKAVENLLLDDLLKGKGKRA